MRALVAAGRVGRGGEETELRGAERREIVGAARKVDVAFVAAHRRAALARPVVIDRIEPVEQLLELFQRGVHARIAQPSGRSPPSAGVDGVRITAMSSILVDAAPGGHDARAVVARVLEPETVERLANGPRFGAQRGLHRSLPPLLEATPRLRSARRPTTRNVK